MKSSRHIRIIFFTLMLDMIGVGILIPIVPYIFDLRSPYYLLNGFNPSHGYVWQGLALALYPLFQFFFAPILGELSDQYGRKRLLLLSLGGTLIGHMLTGFAILTGDIWLFLLGRAIDGATAGNIAIAMASIADVSEDKDKAKNFGMVGAAFGVGFILGPAFGGIIASHFGYAAPFWFSTFLSLINIIGIYYFMRETKTNTHLGLTPNPSPQERGTIQIRLHPLAGVANVIRGFKDKSLSNIFWVNLLFQSGFAFYTAFAGVYMKERFHLDLSQVAYYFVYVGICIVLAQALLIRHVFKRWPAINILKVSVPMLASVILIYIFSYNIYINLVMVPIFTIAFGLSNSAVTSIISKKAGSRQGLVLGISASIAALAGAIPQALAGLLASTLGYVAPMYATVGLMISTLFFIKREE